MWSPYKIAHMSSLIWIYTFCQRVFENIFTDDESRRLIVIGALRVNKCEVSVYLVMILLKYA